MNKAKKKADELVDEHYDLVEDRVEGVMTSKSPSARYYNAVKAALITVKEVLKAYPTEPSESNSIYDQLEQAPKYWEEVKKELESRL